MTLFFLSVSQPFYSSAFLEGFHTSPAFQTKLLISEHYFSIAVITIATYSSIAFTTNLLLVINFH